MDNNIQTPIKEEKGGMIHFVLSHSYSVFLVAVVLGLIFDVVFPFSFFENPIFKYGGVVLIALGSVLIYWSQWSSAQTAKKQIVESERNFAHGPYKYSRNPTHIGISIMTLGLGFILNSVFSIIFVVIASVVTKSIFLRKEESLLEKKYGEVYRTYKEKVGKWL